MIGWVGWLGVAGCLFIVCASFPKRIIVDRLPLVFFFAVLSSKSASIVLYTPPAAEQHATKPQKSLALQANLNPTEDVLLRSVRFGCGSGVTSATGEHTQRRFDSDPNEMFVSKCASPVPGSVSLEQGAF